MRTFRLPFLLLCLLAMVPSHAAASDGWFGGLKLAPWVNRADALLNIDRSTDSPTRKRPMAAAPTRRFDVEVGYSESAPDNSARGGVSPNRGFLAGHDFRLAGVGELAFGDKLGLTGRLGAFRGDIDSANQYRDVPDLSVHPTYGMGLRYDVSPDLRLQGGWDRYHLGQSLRPGDGGVDLLSIGLKYRF